MKVVVDVYPLANIRYSGIPQMTWHLARNFMDREGVTFAIGQRILEDRDIQALVSARSGKGLEVLKHRHASRFLSASQVSSSLYFCPHSMSLLSRGSRGSVRVVHDISTITHPEFHHPETIAKDRKQLVEQMDVCSRIITVSESSKREIVSYLGVPGEKIVVAEPGIAWEASQVDQLSMRSRAFPYVLVLGTREPRKNIRLVLKYLSRYEQHVRQFGRRFVIAGPQGWGVDDLDEGRGTIKSLIDDGWVQILGHVEEVDKLVLLAQADFLISPSITEGFGSPAAEALSLGVPVASSWGGALPDTVGPSGYFFDPYSVDSLADCIDRLHTDLTINAAAVRRTAYERGRSFSWDACAGTIWSTLEEVWREGPLARTN